MYKEHFSSEETLLRHFHKGSNSALKHIFTLYYKPLVFFANKIINDLPQAEDITAESFYKLYIRRQSFDSLPHIKAFLYMACRNACLDWQKARIRHQASHRQIQYLASSTTLNAAFSTGDHAMNDINAVVAQLPRKCRAIFELLFYHGKSTSEVAVQLGISTKNVTNQKHRAIQMIRQALAKKEQLSLALGFLFQALAA